MNQSQMRRQYKPPNFHETRLKTDVRDDRGEVIRASVKPEMVDQFLVALWSHVDAISVTNEKPDPLVALFKEAQRQMVKFIENQLKKETKPNE